MNGSKFTNLFKGDRTIWIVFMLLALISVMEVFSSSSLLGFKSGNYWKAASFHSFTILLGVIFMIIAANIPCRYYKILTTVAVPLSVLFLLLVYIIGTAENDASRWIGIGFLKFQPSEMAKGTMVLTTAHILSSNQTETGAANKNAMRYVLYAAVGLILPIIPENFSTGCLLSLVVFMMLILGRVPWIQIGKLVGAIFLLVGVFVGVIFLLGDSQTEDVPQVVNGHQVTEVVMAEQVEKKPYRPKVLHRLDLWKKRIENFAASDEVDPRDYDLSNNMQVGHANIAIAKSGFFGVGPGNSVQRDFLPLAFSDFIFAIVFEELGWIGAALVVLLYIILLFRTGTIANRCQNAFPAYLAMGMALLMVTQALFNMMVAVGLAPVTGQPLPLISKGGTSTIFNCLYIGVILSVSRTAQRREDFSVNGKLTRNVS